MNGFGLSGRWQKNRGVLSSPIEQVDWAINWATDDNFSLTVEQLWSDYQKHDELDVIKDQEINIGLVIEF